MEAYKLWVRRNRDLVRSFESLANGLTWILPERFANSEIAPEAGPQGPQLQKVLERLTGQSTVPNVFIGGKHIGGCTDTVKLYRKGELATLLSELDINVNNS